MVPSQSCIYPPPLPASPIPLLVLVSVGLQPRDSLPVVILAGLQTRPSLLSPSFPSPLAAIPFRITSFAHPHHVTLIESHSCKEQGRGWVSGASSRPKHFFFFPQRINIQHTAPPATPLFSSIYLTVPVTHRVGVLLSTRHPMKGLCPVRVSGVRDFFAMRSTGHSSARLSKLSAFEHFNAAFPLFTAHYSLPTASHRTSTPPPLIYGIIPPHRDNTHNPLHNRGGFSD